MGIRPKIQLLCGITDFKVSKSGRITDPRYKVIKDKNGAEWDEWDPSKLLRMPPMPSDKVIAGPSEVLNKIIKMRYICQSLKKLEYMGEVVQWDSESGKGNVIGTIIEELPYAGEAVYALTTVVSQFANKKNSPMFVDLPSLPLKDDFSSSAMYLREVEKAVQRDPRWVWKNMDEVREIVRGMNKKKRSIRNKQNYVYAESDMWLTKAELVLNKIGLNVKQKDLKYFLYCQWS